MGCLHVQWSMSIYDMQPQLNSYRKYRNVATGISMSSKQIATARWGVDPTELHLSAAAAADDKVLCRRGKTEGAEFIITEDTDCWT